ncbi:hypothetical protein Pla86_35980 [Planctomycetes bacterium Pla86]|uniref:Uncharacterized protein n=1 Tax=Engelhardtia mirabilis TaxID=2528011 RepID=A0A518BND8_9BACT|nr:hypothetical protein Pla133_36000 [Planctomycetes bacterium Pla133]QDV02827.1 hypothetical protein Pla86_35980 [Planctomycetes bacterium Pla86]
MTRAIDVDWLGTYLLAAPARSSAGLTISCGGSGDAHCTVLHCAGSQGGGGSAMERGDGEFVVDLVRGEYSVILPREGAGAERIWVTSWGVFADAESKSLLVAFAGWFDVVAGIPYWRSISVCANVEKCGSCRRRADAGASPLIPAETRLTRSSAVSDAGGLSYTGIDGFGRLFGDVRVDLAPGRSLICPMQEGVPHGQVRYRDSTRGLVASSLMLWGESAARVNFGESRSFFGGRGSVASPGRVLRFDGSGFLRYFQSSSWEYVSLVVVSVDDEQSARVEYRHDPDSAVGGAQLEPDSISTGSVAGW